VRPASDINDLPSHTPAKATTDGKEQLAAVAHQRTLVWKSARAEGTILADVGDNLGRYIVERCKNGRFEFRHQGQPIGMFTTADEALVRLNLMFFQEDVG
jgi:hypothetical protein